MQVTAGNGHEKTSAGGVVFDRRGRVAVVLQRSRSLRWRWTLPKGRLEAGESIESAALREVREETGIGTRIVSYLGVYAGKRRFTHYFGMVRERDEGQPDDETRKVRFVRPARAWRLLRSARDRLVLDRALKVALVGAPLGKLEKPLRQSPRSEAARAA